jgi:hypothetical protein
MEVTLADTVVGEVTAIRRDQKGLQVNGDWYSSFNKPKGIENVSKGDVVTFSYKTNGRYKNIASEITHSEEDGTAGSGASSGGTTPRNSSGGASRNSGDKQNGRSGFPVGPNEYQRTIARQNALTNSCNLAASIGLVDNSMSPAEIAEAIIPIAERLEEFTTGDRDIRIAKKIFEENKKGKSAKETKKTSTERYESANNETDEDKVSDIIN